MISTLHVARLKAWGAHGFTATGVVLAFLATLALLDNQPKACLLWLGLALIVDGVDGSLARRVNVQTVLPSFDGSVLDLVIDYLTYVFIPALFIYRYIALPDFTPLFTVSVILVSSLFCFCNVNMKSKDNYFQGFPAAWNVVALCVYIIQPAAWITLLTVMSVDPGGPARTHDLLVPRSSPMRRVPVLAGPGRAGRAGEAVGAWVGAAGCLSRVAVVMGGGNPGD